MKFPRRVLLMLVFATAAALVAPMGAASAEPSPRPSAPSPNPSYSPPPDPGAAPPLPPAAEQLRSAETGRLLAQAEGTAFYSSLELGDPQPTWTNTAERSSNVTGSMPGGIPGSIADKVAEIAASGEYAAGGEVKENVGDSDINTKWLVFTSTAWVQYKLSESVAVVHYALTSANDAPERDPRDWQFQGSQDGQSWTTLDTRAGETFPARYQRKEYRFTNTIAYLYYRLNVTSNGGGGIIQLAEWELSDGDTSPKPPSDMRSQVGIGPTGGFVSRPRAGFTGLKALQYAGSTTAQSGGFSYNKVFEVDIPVTWNTELSYVVFPEFTAADLHYPSTYVAVDLAFSDGTFLSRLGARDQHGAVLSPRGQGESKTLYADQWNYKQAEIGKVARGKTIRRILVAYDSPVGPLGFRGWVDDIKIVAERKRQPYQAFHGRFKPSEFVTTTRGTHSTGGFSRGNNFPATALPHGFNFWTPMTNAGTTGWLYEYHRANNPANVPQIQAFAASHEPSPWMGDRQTFQVMPSAADGIPNASRTARALPFRHANEVAQPHYYSVGFDNGLKTEIAPTDHAAMFRFTFPGDNAKLLFDNVNNNGGLTLDVPNAVVTGFSDVRSGLSTGATRMYYYAVFDRPVTDGAKLAGQGRDNVLGYVTFNAGADRTVQMRIASSLISVEQARHNLELEIAATDSFEAVKRRAQQAWDAKLRIVEVEGASEDQLVTLYSSLYRLFLYPNSGFENVGTNAAPVYKHAVQSATTTVPNPPVVDGKVYVNNGFWDTYRTTWPAYSLLTPSMAGEMADGFVQQYKDGGWIARWSSPGYADLMVGTSSDVAFADAYLKGANGFDIQAAYDAAVKNATVTPPTGNVGRKGLSTSQFLGYTSMQSAGEAMSWAMDGYINDFGIANMAKALGRMEEYEYFLSRAQNYVHMFDPATGFFQGRNADGSWRQKPANFDPRVWGFDYTETNAWNMAFHVPQDGQGLANLYGGKKKLAEKLDTFFATPETATFPGSYGGIIHEMREARDVRMGQYGHSNQPSHHIPYMYNNVGQPWKAQEKVREALSRLYLGSEIGQGYPGDEDNGEMSAWYIFSALGFYPLQMGSPSYAIGSPLFTKATIHLENGRDLVIKAPNNSARNVYVQDVRVNGKRYNKTYLPHDVLSRGGVIEFGMGPRPSRWGTGKEAAPPSITKGDQAPSPLRDMTLGATNPLFDNNSNTQSAITGPVTYQFPAGQPITFYTLSSGSVAAAEDPAAWALEGSNDGLNWTVLDERSAQAFPWRLQTRAFKVAKPGAYVHYRLSIKSPATATLSEIELLNPAPAGTSPLVTAVEGAIASPGETVPVNVTISNYAKVSASGQVTAAAPADWTVQPPAPNFGPIAPGASQTVTLQVTVASAAAPGSYPIDVAITSNVGPAKDRALVTLVGDTIQFTPGTSAETPWLFDPGASQLDGVVFDGRARFTDGDSYATYRFTVPSDVTGGSLMLDIGNQFHVQVSADNQTWRTVVVESNDVRDLSNRAERTFDLNELRGDGRTFYLRINDSQPANGWGAWLARVGVTLQR